MGTIKNITRENWLENNDWLDKINDDLAGWAYSCYDLQKMELEKWQTHYKEALEKMTARLQLENTRLWGYERDEPGVHQYYLRKLLSNYIILAQMNQEASEVLFGKLRDLARDYAKLIEKLIKK